MKNNLTKTIIILVGIPHSGKTTFSNYVKEKYGFEVVSTDQIKKELYKDSKNYDIKKLFQIQKIRLKDIFQKNKNVIADSNNSKVIYRKEIIELANIYKYNIITIYIESKIEDVINRLKKNQKQHIIENIDFYCNEIELENVNYIIYNNSSNKTYYKKIDKIFKELNNEDKQIK